MERIDDLICGDRFLQLGNQLSDATYIKMDDSPVHRIYGSTQIMQEVLDEKHVQTKLLYMNFSIHTYPQVRLPLWETFSSCPWVTAEPPEISLEARKRYLAQMAQHKFVLCPRGNGVDTHRLWETLYMGSIPIVQRHVALEEFDDLPILWIDESWKDEITEARLIEEYARIKSTTSWNMEKLQFSYWEDKIRALV
jgi:hypothetical protein